MINQPKCFLGTSAVPKQFDRIDHLPAQTVKELIEVLYQETGVIFSEADAQELGQFFLTTVAQSLKIRMRLNQKKQLNAIAQQNSA